jgi:hypothetical protein
VSVPNIQRGSRKLPFINEQLAVFKVARLRWDSPTIEPPFVILVSESRNPPHSSTERPATQCGEGKLATVANGDVSFVGPSKNFPLAVKNDSGVNFGHKLLNSLPAGKRLRRDPAGLPRRIRPGRIKILM